QWAAMPAFRLFPLALYGCDFTLARRRVDGKHKPAAGRPAPRNTTEEATMELRRLGKSGTLVSPICLGAMMFADRTDEGEAGRIVASAREAGINFIDTADVYVQGKSEEMTGRLLKAERNHWVIATKFGAPMGDDANQHGAG